VRPTPLVSVVMPARNAAGTITEGATSVLGQTLDNLELIIVDDASTDETSAIASRLEALDPRVTVERCETRLGVAAARNFGIERARGEFVHFLDADDLLDGRALASLVEACDASGEAGASCGFQVVGRDGRAVHEHRNRPDTIDLEALIDRAYLVTHGHIVRRDALGDHRFDAARDAYEDLDLWMRLAAAGVRWANVPETLATYRFRPGGLSKRFLRMGWAGCDLYARVFGSSPRIRRVQGRLASDYATRAVVVSGERSGEASRLLRAHLRTPMDAEGAAGAARMSFVFALGVGFDAEALDTKLAPWWASLEDMGLGRTGLREDASALLTEREGARQAALGAA